MGGGGLLKASPFAVDNADVDDFSFRHTRTAGNWPVDAVQMWGNSGEHLRRDQEACLILPQRMRSF